MSQRSEQEQSRRRDYQRRMRIEQQALGLCSVARCQNTPEEGFKNCADHRAATRAAREGRKARGMKVDSHDYAKERIDTQRKVRLGLCAIKGCKNDHESEKNWCKEHYDKRHAYMRDRLARGLCRACDTTVEPGKTMCPVHLETTKDSVKRFVYGVSRKRYEEMVAEQNGVCAICKRPETKIIFGKVQRLSVDHDHQTGVVRGLLCSECNLTVGFVEKSYPHIDAIMSYVERHRLAPSEGHGR